MSEIIYPVGYIDPRTAAKEVREKAVASIKVTTSSGKVFDGDETSQERMSRALRVADITGQGTCVWVLADNTSAEVTRVELEEALALSMQAQAELWVV